MKRRYILYRRKRGGMFYLEDTETRKQESTGTRNRAEATSLLNARNESIRQPQLNLQIAKAYLAGTDSGVATRTWQQALDAIVETKVIIPVLVNVVDLLDGAELMWYKKEKTEKREKAVTPITMGVLTRQLRLGRLAAAVKASGEAATSTTF
jgi:hypothetical protein